MAGFNPSGDLGEIVFADLGFEAVADSVDVGDAEEPVGAVGAAEEIGDAVVENVVGGKEYAGVGGAVGKGVYPAFVRAGAGPGGEEVGAGLAVVEKVAGEGGGRAGDEDVVCVAAGESVGAFAADEDVAPQASAEELN